VARDGRERERPHAERAHAAGWHDTGKGRQEFCGVSAASPNLVGNNRLDACDIDEQWTTNFLVWPRTRSRAWTWLTPTNVLSPRFTRFQFTFDC
jgi:hypothetical protein